MNWRFWRTDAAPATLERNSILDDWPFPYPPPPELVTGGALLGAEQATGLPAFLGVLQLLTGSIALVPQLVYRGRGAARMRDAESWQWELLHDRPSDEATPATFRGDLMAGLVCQNKAFVRKFKGSSGRVRHLIPLDPRKVKVRRSGGRLVFDDSTEGKAHPVTRDQRDIIYIRGYALNGGIDAHAPITAARLAFQTALRRMIFELKHYVNDTRPGVYYKFPQHVDREKAREWLELIEAQHKGLENAHGAFVAGGGAEIEVVPINLQDAQFVEAFQLTSRYMAGMYQIPFPLLAIGENGPTDNDRLNYVTFALGPRYVLIDQAFNADLDLFPREDDRFCESLADALLRPSTEKRYEAYKYARQAGWLTANEIRALENYPPKDGGNELQQTPVGGAPNDDEAKNASAVLWSIAAGGSALEQLVIGRAIERAKKAGLDPGKELEEQLLSTTHRNGDGEPQLAPTT